MQQKCLQILLPVPIRRLFDYLPPNSTQNHTLKRGMRVQVPFGKRQMTGIIWNVNIPSEYPEGKLKRVECVLDPHPLLDDEFCTFIEKCSKYYHHPLGEVAFCALPTLLRDGKALLESLEPQKWQYSEPPYQLNSAQQSVLTCIDRHINHFQALLLEGVTGSGKTEIYIQAAKSVLEKNKQVLILVPEIALTPQTIQRFSNRFGEGVVHFHSKLTPKQRLTSWQLILEQKSNIVVGTRSSIFLPFSTLGLIIVDEEHDLSFKQQDGFRYSARDMAILRAKLSSAPILLGSATPSLESLHHAQNGKYEWLRLPNRATTQAPPRPTILDIRRQKCLGGLSPTLLNRIEKTLEAGKQIMLFLNRRGFSPALICHHCGWLAGCKRCDARYTFHAQLNKLICHHCEQQMPPPLACPECQQTQLIPLGQGTERLEQVLSERFPNATLGRVDSDTTRKKGSLTKLLQSAKDNTFSILIGTQMLAKGHHFPHLQLVALVDTDSGLFSTDFRATERMAQLLIQVGGRAGRAHHQGEVIIQTRHPEHPLFELVAEQNYDAIAQWLVKERKMAALPPYSFLGLFRSNALDQQTPVTLLEQLREQLKSLAPHVNILGPVPAPMVKRQGRYHFQLLLQSQSRGSLHQALSIATTFLESCKLARKVRWSCDVDPLEMN